MAAKSGNENVPRDVWLLLTDNTVVGATVVNNLKTPIIIQATNGVTPPADGNSDGIRLLEGQGIKSNDSLAVLFPGVTSPNHIHVLSHSVDGEVFISHAG